MWTTASRSILDNPERRSHLRDWIRGIRSQVSGADCRACFLRREISPKASPRSGERHGCTGRTDQVRLGGRTKEAPPVARRGLYIVSCTLFRVHCFVLNVGGDLLSHTLASAVPSALEGLASGFGMGPGVPHSANTTDNTIHLSPPRPTQNRPARGVEHTTPTHTPRQTGRESGWTMVVCSGSHSGCEQQC